MKYVDDDTINVRNEVSPLGLDGKLAGVCGCSLQVVTGKQHAYQPR